LGQKMKIEWISWNHKISMNTVSDFSGTQTVWDRTPLNNPQTTHCWPNFGLIFASNIDLKVTMWSEGSWHLKLKTSIWTKIDSRAKPPLWWTKFPCNFVRMALQSPSLNLRCAVRKMESSWPL
jgi:hypothetical protein